MPSGIQRFMGKPHARSLRAHTLLRPMRTTVAVQPTSTAEENNPTALEGKFRFFTFNTSTNGLNTQHHRILELALVDVETGEGFHRIINPRSPPEWQNHKNASKIHGKPGAYFATPKQQRRLLLLMVQRQSATKASPWATQRPQVLVTA